MPTWVPKYNAQFVQPLIDNLLTFIKTNMADALVWASGGINPPYPGFSAAAVFNSTIGLDQKVFPDLMVWKVTSPTLDEAGDAGEVHELHHITLCFELTGTDVTELTTRQFCYMRALDSICRSIPAASLYAGMIGTRHGAVEVINHDYGMPRKFEKDLWLRAGMLTAAVAMAETRNNSFP